jgi:hypothetical protein
MIRHRVFFVLIHRKFLRAPLTDTMTHHHIYETTFSLTGRGRVSSPKLRQSLSEAQSFEGLPEGLSRYELLISVKRAGKAAGFTPRMITLLDYYMSYTRECDWEQGSRPVVYQSLSKTAMDLGISERQVQRLEQALFEAGALTWQDSGNHKRYGQRDKKTRKLLYAFGADLSPLYHLQSKLDEILERKKLYDNAWFQTKRDISSHRRAIVSALAELEEQGRDISAHYKVYQPISKPVRTYMSLHQLRDLLTSHIKLLAHIHADLENTQIESINDSYDSKMSQKMSCSDAANVVKTHTSIQIQFNKSSNDLTDRLKKIKCKGFSGVGGIQPGSTHRAQKTYSEPTKEQLILKTGLQHITLRQIISVCPQAITEHLPLSENIGWSDLVEAAFRLKGQLYISQQAWAQACNLLTRNGAAICVILTQLAAQREYNPVKRPGLYFNAMLTRVYNGELNLRAAIETLAK